LNKDSYRRALDKLGLSRRAAARFLMINERTSRNYALGEGAVPPTIAMLLQI
jgi:hypothetical protein